MADATRPRVLCFADVSFCPEAHDYLRQVAEVDVRPPDRQFLLERIAEYDAYLASLHVRFDREVVERGKRLKVVATPTTGLDHLDLDALREHNIELINIKTEFGLLEKVTATAEMAWALMLAAVRKIPMAHQAAMQGRWARDAFRGRQMSTKTLGVLGVGRLGTMVVDYGRAFRMNVIGCDHNPRKRIADLEYVSFDQLLARSDVISIHIHLTPENLRLIDAGAFARMKDGVVIVNTSRGGIIDEEAFVTALEQGKVGAAGLDVIEGEWRDDLAEHPLIRYARSHDNLVIVPHLGGITYESQGMSARFIADKLADRLKQLATSSASR